MPRTRKLKTIVGKGPNDLMTWLRKSEILVSDLLFSAVLRNVHTEMGPMAYRHSQSICGDGRPFSGLLQNNMMSTAALLEASMWNIVSASTGSARCQQLAHDRRVHRHRCRAGARERAHRRLESQSRGKWCRPA